MRWLKDPQDWHRTGYYRYLVAGWDAESGRYECWEPSGLHTFFATEAEVQRGIDLQERLMGSDRDLSKCKDFKACWKDGELTSLPRIEPGGKRKNWSSTLQPGAAVPESRDAVFTPRMSGWKPYGTLEMAGPLLFQLRSLSRGLAQEPEANVSVIDVGAGHGRMSAWLEQVWGFNVRALDVVLPQWPEYDKIELFNGRSLPLEDKSVDIVLFAFVLHHCRHFELQRALLSEAARVARHYICIAEDTPETEQHRRGTRGHDSKGSFLTVQSWRDEFRRAKLPIHHEGPVWEGPPHGPSPYHCTRRFFVLKVPTWVCPLPQSNHMPSMVACRAFGCHGGNDTGAEEEAQQEAPVELTEEDEHALRDLRPELMQRAGTADVAASAEGGLAWPTLTSFEQLKLPPALRHSLSSQGFVTPTPIQAAAIPQALAGVNLIGIAATGSGKTLAFLLPSLLRLLAVGISDQGPSMLVLLPTRELCLQVHSCATELLATAASPQSDSTRDEWEGEAEGSTSMQAELSSMQAVAVWGGGQRWQQLKGFRTATIVAATPGRLLDLACELEGEGRLPLATVRVLVLDEGDRMLGEGMGEQLEALAGRTRGGRQTLFFSATWSDGDGVSGLASRVCRSPPVLLRISNSTGGSANPNIEQRIEVFDQDEEEEREACKRARLLVLLEEALGQDRATPGQGSSSLSKALVFCMTRKFADGLVDHLNENSWPAVAVHGNKLQSERLENLDRFASGEVRVLVATDVLGRGLDIPLVTHVFVYDFPYSVEEYLHRIGRTARGVGGHGSAVCFFEYASCLPNLAQDLLNHLEVHGLEAPADLRRVAAEVESGHRFKRDDRKRTRRKGGYAHGSTAADSLAEEGPAGPNDRLSDKEALPLATLEELSGQEGWHAAGHRCWMITEQEAGATSSKATGSCEATGWIVFRTGGALQTHCGAGRWVLQGGSMAVELGVEGAAGTPAPRRYSLKLHDLWEGRAHKNFRSVSEGPRQPLLIGWVSRNRLYRLSRPRESGESRDQWEAL